MKNRYENAIKAINKYHNAEITAKEFMDEYGYIVFDALHECERKEK